MSCDPARPIRALCLFSGGLDSQLAVCVLRDQGIDVHGVLFESPFFAVAAARTAAADLGLPIFEVNFSRDIIGLLDNPPHGFGACLNPCIDCHALMLRRAGELMEEQGFHFLATGEVLDERPMSQNRQSLRIVARDSGYEDRVLRPLSARRLPETLPERRGWVDRSRLLAWRGRGRKEQLLAAEAYRLRSYPAIAGGCRLTEPNFCRRLKDLKRHEGLDGERSIELLRYGRHLRLSDRVKLIVGRNENDNAVLEGRAELYDLVLRVEGVPGPIGLLPLTAGADQLHFAAAVCARYSDVSPGAPATVRVRSARGVGRLEVVPAQQDEVERCLI